MGYRDRPYYGGYGMRSSGSFLVMVVACAASTALARSTSAGQTVLVGVPATAPVKKCSASDSTPYQTTCDAGEHRSSDLTTGKPLAVTTKLRVHVDDPMRAVRWQHPDE